MYIPATMVAPYRGFYVNDEPLYFKMSEEAESDGEGEGGLTSQDETTSPIGGAGDKDKKRKRKRKVECDSNVKINIDCDEILSTVLEQWSVKVDVIFFEVNYYIFYHGS